MADSKLIYVKAAEKSGEQVALWEVDERHPANAAGAHEAFIAGQDSDPQQVYPTPKVLTALKDEWIVATTAKGKETAPPAAVANTPATTPAPANPGNGEG